MRKCLQSRKHIQDLNIMQDVDFKSTIIHFKYNWLHEQLRCEWMNDWLLTWNLNPSLNGHIVTGHVDLSALANTGFGWCKQFDLVSLHMCSPDTVVVREEEPRSWLLRCPAGRCTGPSATPCGHPSEGSKTPGSPASPWPVNSPQHSQPPPDRGNSHRYYMCISTIILNTLAK